MPAAAKRLSQCVETVHAATYFAPESIEAASAVGFKGFWMGYFGFRASPLGAANAATVDALFFNFARSMVERAVPDAWDHVSPADALTARAASAGVVLRRSAPDLTDDAADGLADRLQDLAASVPVDGRAMGAANRAVDRPDDPVERLWQACTDLRELRGDAHVAALIVEGVDGCAAHLIAAAHKGLPHRVLRPNRGWTEEEWADAAERLRADGWLDGQGALTPSGQRRRDAIEDTTDRLAFSPDDDLDGAITAIESLALAVAAAGDINFPNPMGLARLT